MVSMRTITASLSIILLLTGCCILLLPPIPVHGQYLDPDWGTSTTNTLVCNPSGEQSGVKLAEDGAGGCYVIWRDLRNSGNADIYAQHYDRNGQALWTANGIVVTNANNWQQNPQAIEDGAGGVFVLWEDKRFGNDIDLYAERLDKNGSKLWNGVKVTGAAKSQMTPRLIQDGTGGALVAWQDNRSGNFDIYAQRLDKHGTCLWTTDGQAVCTDAAEQKYVRIAQDGSGGAYLVWQESRTPYPSVYLQYLNASGKPQWTANGQRIYSVSAGQTWPMTVSNGSGGAIITWLDARVGPEYAIFAQLVDKTGASLWTPGGVMICDSLFPKESHAARTVTDGAGGAIVVWNQDIGSDWNVYCQRIDRNGTAKWNSAQIKICTQTSAQTDPVIADDGLGGAGISWADGRSGVLNIYAQHVASDGSWLWGVDGIPVCNNTAGQEYPYIIKGPRGSLFVGWADSRGGSGNLDIYVHKIGMRIEEPTLKYLDEDTDVNYTLRCNGDVAKTHWSMCTNAPWLQLLELGGNLSGIPQNDWVGDVWVNVTAIERGVWDNLNFTFKVNNTPPEITTVPILTTLTGKPYNCDFNSTDDGHGSVKWSMRTNATWLGTMNQDTGHLSATPAKSQHGRYWVNVSVSDGNGGTNYLNYTLQVIADNHPPAITTGDITTCEQDALYSVNYEFSELDSGDVITWGLNTDAGWLKMNSTTGLLSGTPGNSDVGQYWVNVSVRDNYGGLGFSNFTLSVTNVNDYPVIEGLDLQEIAEDKFYHNQYDVTDIDPNDHNFTWSLSTDADFLTLDQTGNLSGTPDNEDVGDHFVEVKVEDGNGGQDIRNFTLTVQNVNDPPTWISVPPNATIEADSLYSYNAQAVDVDASASIAFKISSDPKSEIIVGPGTGKISWTPAEVGEYTVTLTATDGTVTITHKYELTVIPASGNRLPTAELMFPTNGSNLDITNPTLIWSAEDEDGDNVTCEVFLSATVTTVEARASDSKVGAGVSSGYLILPTALIPGTQYFWTVLPSDAKADGTCASGIWHFTISSAARLNNPPVFTSTPILTAYAGKAWTYTPAATDSDGDIVSFSLDSGPAGMGLASGVLSWTPTAGQLGSHVVSLSATDGKSKTPQAFSVIVGTKANAPPSVTDVPEQTIRAGERFSYPISATDEDGDKMSFSVETGPPELVINSTGMISWKPGKSDIGRHLIVIGVSDNDGKTVVSFNITVEQASPGSRLFGKVWWMIPLLLLLMITVVIVIVIVMRRKRGKTDDEAETNPSSPTSRSRPVSAGSMEAEVDGQDIFKAKMERDLLKKNQPRVTQPMASAQPVDASLAPQSEGPDLSPPAMAGPVGIESVPAPELAQEAATHLAGWDIGDEMKINEGARTPLMLPPATVFQLEEESAVDVDEVFIITNTGIMLNHYVKTESTRIDEDILAGMLSAVQSFIKDSTKRKSELKQLRLGDFDILVEKGDNITAVAFTTSKEASAIIKQLRRLVDDIEGSEAETLRNWDGNVETMTHINDYTFKFMNGQYK